VPGTYAEKATEKKIPPHDGAEAFIDSNG